MTHTVHPLNLKGSITLEVTMVTMHAQTSQHHHTEQFQWNTIAIIIHT